MRTNMRCVLTMPGGRGSLTKYLMENSVLSEWARFNSYVGVMNGILFVFVIPLRTARTGLGCLFAFTAVDLRSSRKVSAGFIACTVLQMVISYIDRKYICVDVCMFTCGMAFCSIFTEFIASPKSSANQKNSIMFFKKKTAVSKRTHLQKELQFSLLWIWCFLI